MTKRVLNVGKIVLNSSYRTLLNKVRETLLEGQARIDQERVRTYWETGRVIDAYILKHADRAEYGKKVIVRLSKDINVSETLLHRCVRFVQTYPDLQKVAMWPKFSWSHYRQFMTISDDKKRLRLEKTVAEKDWSVAELALRIKDVKHKNEPSPGYGPSQKPSISNKPLIPLRGTLYTYRLVERPNLSSGTESDLLVDLGFGVYHEVDNRLLSTFSKDEIVESRPKEDVYKFYKTVCTTKDLFTYAAYVEKVIDGDTLKVRLDLGFNIWTRQVLRLRDIDCPEVGTPAGDEARNFVRSHLKESSQIIVRSSRSDKYDRYLADVFVAQGSVVDKETDIYLNNLLLETGRAKRWK